LSLAIVLDILSSSHYIDVTLPSGSLSSFLLTMKVHLIFLFLPYLVLSLPIRTTPKPQQERKLPEAIIIGVKKAGTRALLEFLRLNPHVKAPGPEVHFFDNNFEKGLDWYRSQMPESVEGDITIEKSPSYFISKTAPSRIKEINPKMKLIVVLRDPVTRAISDYTQASSKRRLGQMPSFERMAVGDCAPWSKVNCSVKTRGVNSGWGAVRIGQYHKYLQRWLKEFPLDQFHFVDGQKLIDEPAEEVKKVEEFLGLKPVVTPADFEVDSVKKFPCIKNPDGTHHCLGKTKGRPHPKVAETVLKRLKRFYEPENDRLFSMIHQNFQWN
ncbi:hypothetical protein PMAYCL1PPCAC_32474, partial [Pristionchus mayeri]